MTLDRKEKLYMAASTASVGPAGDVNWYTGTAETLLTVYHRVLFAMGFAYRTQCAAAPGAAPAFTLHGTIDIASDL